MVRIYVKFLRCWLPSEARNRVIFDTYNFEIILRSWRLEIRSVISMFGQESSLTALRYTIFNVIFPLHLTLCFIANALAQVSFLSPLGRKSSKMSVPDQRPHTPACVRTAQNPGFSKSSCILCVYRDKRCLFVHDSL